MNYSEFLSQICHIMKKQYPEASISVQPVLKNNGRRLDGLLILYPGENIAPSIYLNSYYTSYSKGAPLEDILEDIKGIYEKHRIPVPFDISIFQHFERIQKKIFFRLINQSSNLELLSDVPHLPFLDLAIVFFLSLENETIGSSTALIHNKHLELWNTTKEELFPLARSNTRTLAGYEILPMEQLLFPEIKSEASFPSYAAHTLFVLSSHTRAFGAACLLYEDILASFADEIQDDFYVLPSSIHEVLLIPAKKSPPAKALQEMVRDINETEVAPEDILSNQIYLYRAAEHCLKIVLFTGYCPENQFSESLKCKRSLLPADSPSSTGKKLPL